MSVLATPFHSRTAMANENNLWAARNGYTLARAYAGSAGEALAARFRVALIDISWRWHVRLEGARAEEFLGRFATFDAAQPVPGQSTKALWLNDFGAVRGAGVFARHGRESFALIAAASDDEWLQAAAARFDVTCRTVCDGGLALLGPYAGATLARAGLSADLAPLAFKKLFWRGSEITLSRFGEHNGFELWCAPDDAYLLWDRVMRAGEIFGIQAAGLDAADLLDLEAGIARPERDYLPARGADARTPTPPALGLGLESLIAGNNFNGYAACQAARGSEPLRLAGVEIDAEAPAPFAALLKDGRRIGHTMSSAYSPALKRAIALAQIETAQIAPGTEFLLNLPPDIASPQLRHAAARVTALPFLPPPDQILP